MSKPTKRSETNRLIKKAMIRSLEFYEALEKDSHPDHQRLATKYRGYWEAFDAIQRSNKGDSVFLKIMAGE